jgi:hypothetical protein
VSIFSGFPESVFYRRLVSNLVFYIFDIHHRSHLYDSAIPLPIILKWMSEGNKDTDLATEADGHYRTREKMNIFASPGSHSRIVFYETVLDSRLSTTVRPIPGVLNFSKIEL